MMERSVSISKARMHLPGRQAILDKLMRKILRQFPITKEVRCTDKEI